MDIRTKKLILKNGIPLLYTKKPGNKFFDISINIKVGAVNEDNSNRGISHFTEHMCFNGTKKYDKDELTTLPYKFGGSANASTGNLSTQYDVQTLIEYAEEAIDIVTEITYFPIFPKKYLKKEKGIVLEEINESYDDNFDVARELSFTNFNDDRLNHPILGYENTVKNFTREDIVEFHKKHYHTNNSIISVCTDMDEDVLLKMLNDKIPTINGIKNPDFVFDTSVRNYIEKEKKDMQQNILIHQMFFDKKYFPESVIFKIIYGYGMNSKLFNILREEMELCYDIGCFAEYFYNISGLTTYLSFSDTDRKDEIINTIEKIINDMKNISESDFEIAKIQAKRITYLELESSEDMASRAPRKLLKGLDLNSIDIVEELEKLTIQDIVVFTEHLQRENNRAVTFLKKN